MYKCTCFTITWRWSLSTPTQFTAVISWHPWIPLFSGCQTASVIRFGLREASSLLCRVTYLRDVKMSRGAKSKEKGHDCCFQLPPISRRPSSWDPQDPFIFGVRRFCFYTRICTGFYAHLPINATYKQQKRFQQVFLSWFNSPSRSNYRYFDLYLDAAAMQH